MTVPIPPAIVPAARNSVSHNSVLHEAAFVSHTQPRARLSRALPAILLAAATLCLGSPLLAQSSFGSIAVGTTSASQTVTVTAQSAGTVASVNVLTLGQSGMDYAPFGSGTCTNANLAVGNTCTVPVTFTPAAPGARPGAVLLLDSAGNRIGVTFLTGTGSGGLGVFLPGTMQTIAGDGAWTSVLDGNLATQADLDLPEGEVLDGAGNLYIADSAHNRVREVIASTGKITTLAGNGNPSYTGDGGLASAATLNTPASVALDGAGDLYIADSGNNVIRRIVLATGIITTVAGNGTVGATGDGGQATSATLNNPLGVSVDSAGNLYIADSYNHKIREVNASGVIATIAGNGTTQGNGAGSYSGDGGPATAAGLNYPYAVAFDASGNLYIPDSGNNRIRVVNASTQIITTFAGNGVLGYSGDGGPATQAQLYSPSGLVFDPVGNLYIADTQNNRIRKVNAGNISTIAGNGIGVYTGDNASAYAAGLYGPYGLALDPDGNLLIADYFDHRIRRIQVNLATFKLTTPVRQGSKSPTQPQTLEDDGTAALTLTALTPDSNSALDPTVTTCLTTTPLALDTTCVLGAQFAPNTSGNPLTATITTTANSDNSPFLIQITGNATAVNSTTTTLTTNPSATASFGQSVVLQAAVTTGSGTGALTGTVSFSDGSKTLVSGIPINSSGIATYTVSNLTVGLHSLTASYSGDTGHFASTSTPPTPLTVNEATATNLSSSANPSGVGAAVTFTAVVTAPNGGGLVPDGTVNFLDSGTVLGTATLSATGVATFTISTLTNGAHSITAVYGGDSANFILGSTSSTLTQNVTAPTTTAVTSSPNPSGYGVAVTFVATVTPGGSVTPTGSVQFLDNGAQIGSATLSGSPATASFTTSTLAAGQHSITAQYLGSSGNGASLSPPYTQTVAPVQTATTLIPPTPDPGIAGRPVTLTAAIHVLQGTTIPTGSVSFSDGATALGTATLNSSGTATLQVNLSAGQHSLVASYGGSANDGSSTSVALPFTVQLATTQVAVTPSPNPALVLAQVLFSIKVTGNGGVPTGAVTLLVDGKSTATANLDATGAATIPLTTLPVGTHAISASYGGDANDAASASTPLNEVIQPIPTATSLGVTTSGAATANQQSILVATVLGVSGPTPTGTVNFLNGSTVLGSSALDSTGVATLIPNLPTGTYSIVAQYSGDAIHSPSTSQPASLSTAPSTFSLTVNPPSITLKTGQNTTLTVNIASVNQAADTISLGCANLPAAVNCHFAANDLKLVAGGAVTTQLTLDTNNPLSGGATASLRRPGSTATPHLAGFIVPLLGLPLTGLLGWLLWRARRRAQRWLVLVVLLAVSLGGLALSGCGGFSQTTASPGTYTIQVTGVGTQSNQTHYVNLTLTITQ